METTTRSILSKQENDGAATDDNNTSKIIHNRGSNNKERIKKKCTQLLSRIEDIPPAVRVFINISIYYISLTLTPVFFPSFHLFFCRSCITVY